VKYTTLDTSLRQEWRFDEPLQVKRIRVCEGEVEIVYDNPGGRVTDTKPTPWYGLPFKKLDETT
jgi:hypothetical protein